MRDPATFEARLADALGRYADLGPALDDADVARQAITAGRSRWTAATHADGSEPRGRHAAVAYLLLLIALLAATLILAIGALRQESPPSLGSNGAIAFYVQGNDHSGNYSESIASDGSGISRPLTGACPTYSRDGRFITWVSGDAPSSELVIESVDGTASRRVPIVPDYSWDSFRPSYALSPDGSRVAWMKPIRDIGIEYPDGSGEVDGQGSRALGDTAGRWSCDPHRPGLR